MLIDIIPIEKLPWFIVWLDWCVYAYWKELITVNIYFSIHYYLFLLDNRLTFKDLAITDLQLPILFGCSAWVLHCAIRQGYVVG